MKASDFKELQEFCEHKGYQLLNESLEDNTKFFVVSKKMDEWEGVEFVKCNFPDSPMLGRIRRLINIDPTSFDICIEGEKRTIWSRYGWEPSTESAYVDQLKAEAFKRFGEIKEGEVFKREFVINKENELVATKITADGLVFNYYKEYDALTFGGVGIYENGKWATKLPERIEVENIYRNWSGNPDVGFKFSFKFKIDNGGANVCVNKAGEFLASALEKFLNNE